MSSILKIKKNKDEKRETAYYLDQYKKYFVSSVLASSKTPSKNLVNEDYVSKKNYQKNK